MNRNLRYIYIKKGISKHINIDMTNCSQRQKIPRNAAENRKRRNRNKTHTTISVSGKYQHYILSHIKPDQEVCSVGIILALC